MLLRAIAAIPLAQSIAHTGVTADPIAPVSATAVLQLFTAICSGFLTFGLWTPIAASLMALSEVALLFLSRSFSSMNIVMAVLAAAIAMIGPGAWSVDARLFGRKRIQIPPR